MTKVKRLTFILVFFLILSLFGQSKKEPELSGENSNSKIEEEPVTSSESEPPRVILPKPEDELKRNRFYSTFIPTDPTQSVYLNDLLKRIDEKKLYEEKHWYRLQRYSKNLWGGVESESDSVLYFLSPEGRVNPAEEMRATIRAFFAPEPVEEGAMHPQCIYPERYFWLKQKLSFNGALLQERECARFQNWREALDPGSITVVFSSFYMQSPASVLGHTLFKIDSAKNADSELLDYGVNYAANTDDTNPFTYTFRGLTGGYPGMFALFPYYLKVNEYNDMESRDLWEYRLNISKEDRERFLRHLWEMGRNYFDYYFFTQNCSFHMLGLLEAADPDLDISSKASWIVAPPDTVKIYLSVPGLVVDRKYRPSLYSKVKQKIVAMTSEEKEMYWSLLDGEKEIDSVKPIGIRYPLILDTLLDSYRYRKSRDKSSEAEQARYRKFLLLRSKINEQITINENEEMTTPPEDSHSLSRVSTGFGFSNVGPFAEYKYRVAYHDILNTDRGHVPNSEVQFMNFTLRKYEAAPLEFTSMNLVRLLSFTPYNAVSKQFSYGIDIGTDTVMVEKEKFQKDLNVNRLGALLTGDPTAQLLNMDAVARGEKDGREYIRKQAGNFEVLYGYSFQDEFSQKKAPVLISFLGGVKAQPAAFFNGGVRYGPEAVVSVLKEYGSWKFQLYGAYQYYQGSGNENNYSGNLKIRYLINKNNELRFEVNSMRYYAEALLSYNFLF
ncbi:PF13387 domain protein [Leptospira inadai serovar Lyme str. 10]|uniref:PF13387 domain protein n=2 Tax=Leptospira inadai serovar Lyme TaxID=293084 RepID=V6HKT6_9LEPT|nr:DUF4105 domain-containing protein [Leptospira inadai]EQA37510.1 PF13387 domain protein [Leptospira inadai serovar Lyme str. 10]PNV71901.1 DUF4105 domain-containing protein [Leptospira inadai serovar Lyme]